VLSCQIISSLPADQAEGARIVAQNKELTAALIKLRDASQEQSKIQEETILELGEQLKEATAEADKVSGLTKQLAEAKEQVETLKHQIDEAQGFSSMVEELTEKNLILGEENKKLQGQVAHMQTLIDAAEEVEDGHVEYEAQMQSEIETKDAELQESARVIATKEKQIA
jgi:chromosome segregation ATPase